MLAFPVSGKDSKAIGSFWGVPRDGGRRKHEGIDIFAPKGTPVVATSNGTISRTGTDRLGGKVVFLKDSKRHVTIYYAHLDTQLVAQGAAVSTGDILGTVGNTGNAKTTPPHLHFGIYKRYGGAVDPLPYVKQVKQSTPVITSNAAAAGEMLRTKTSAVLKKGAGKSDGDKITLPAECPVKIVSASLNGYIAETPDGKRGFVEERSLEKVTHTDIHFIKGTAPLLESPESNAVVIKTIKDSAVDVCGKYQNYLLVSLPGNNYAWLLRQEQTGPR